jgi:CRP/FNR family transcriptional regulator, cyclic AMP receptor protein
MRLMKSELSELELFSQATRSELAVIAKQLTRLSVPAGRVLVREGTVGDEFLILINGEAEVRQDGDYLATVGRGDVVGEMALLHKTGRGVRNATVTALTDVEFYVGSRAEFRQVIATAPSVAEKIRQTASARAAADRELVAA